MNVPDVDLIWQRTCDQFLSKELNTLQYNTWVKAASPSLDSGGLFVLSVPNEVTYDHLVQYKPLIENALQLATSRHYPVEVRVQSDKIIPANDPGILKQDEPNEDRFNPAYNFDSFVVGSGNEFAYATCVAVASLDHTMNNNPLFLYGGSGMGKTHLLHAIGNQVTRRFPHKNVVYVNTEKFINDFIDAIGEKRFDTFRNKYRMADMLLIDDIQFLENKERMQEEFFHTFNALYEAGRNIVITCDKPPSSLKTLTDRLITRFSSGLIVDIAPPEYETRVAILRQLAQSSNLEIDDDVFDYIATNISSNIRELEGAFSTLVAYSMLGHGFSLESARTALRDFIQPSVKKRLTSDIVMNVVANYYNVTVDDLKSRKRSNDVVIPRQLAMYLCRNMLNMTFKDIGEVFGGKNHATAIHAYDKIKQEEEINDQMRQVIKDISLRLQP